MITFVSDRPITNVDFSHARKKPIVCGFSVIKDAVREILFLENMEDPAPHSIVDGSTSCNAHA